MTAHCDAKQKLTLGLALRRQQKVVETMAACRRPSILVIACRYERHTDPELSDLLIFQGKQTVGILPAITQC